MNVNIQDLIKKEEQRQKDTLQMIPSENHVSKNIRLAVGSVLMNKYSEGYPKKRYYQGNEYIDEIESIAIEKAKKIFGVPHANVQPYSGSPANIAVYFALLDKGDTIMGMNLSAGGHLTHGHDVNFSGRFFKSIQYPVDKKTNRLDYDEIEKLARKHKPKIIISGSTAYPRKIDFKRIGEIADSVGAYHLADISHIAGLVVGKKHASPVSYAHIVTTTTHKTFRGPRGAIILVTKKGLKKDNELDKKIDKAIFPGLQGGPHNNTTAGIALALEEMENDSFKKYANQIVLNAKTLEKELKKYDFNLITGGTDNHLLLIDLTNKNIDGWCAAWALEYAGIIVNRNAIPYDTKSPFYPSGIRLGTPAVTTRGMKEKEMIKIASWINEVIEIAKKVPQEDRKEFKKLAENDTKIAMIRKEVKKMCDNFPLP